MPTALRFETPENVQVQYEPAGLGTRFVAWFVDQLVLWVSMFVVFIVLLVAGASFGALEDVFDKTPTHHDDHAVLYFVGFIVLVWGLGSFVYFGCCELFLRGQTIGKRSSNIRVIKSNGFQLDPGSILVRNMFRVVDHIPPMWIFPALSRLSQRAGDMVAGTLVVVDSTTRFSPIRTVLGERTAADAEFRFDVSMLKRLSANDFIAVERVLERVPVTMNDAQAELVNVYVLQIAKKLAIDPPPSDRHRRFLEDLLAAEFRRQDRNLA